MVPELLEVSELEETNLSSRSFMSGSPSVGGIIYIRKDNGH